MASLAEIQQLVQQIKDELPTLILRSQIQPQQIAVGEGLSDISRRLGLIQAGEFRSGNGIEPGLGFSGVRIGYPAFTYAGEEWNIVGVENDTLQVGIRASDGKLVFGGGDGWLDEFGLTFANQEGFVQFLDTNEGGTMQIFADGTNSLVLKNEFGDNTSGNIPGIRLDVDTNAHTVMQWLFEEDQTIADRAYFEMYGDAGSKASFSNEVWIEGEGLGGEGWNALTMNESTNTPNVLEQDTQGRMYFRGNKVIFQWNDGGTVRYKYLDLTGTGVTWVHTTTAP